MRSGAAAGQLGIVFVRSVRTVLALFLIGCAVVGYIIYGVGWRQKEPYFLTKSEVRSYVCEFDTSDQGPVTLSIANAGQTIVVKSLGQKASVTFQRGGLAGDFYEGGNVRLFVDPEVYVDGMEGGHRGPCN